MSRHRHLDRPPGLPHHCGDPSHRQPPIAQSPAERVPGRDQPAHLRRADESPDADLVLGRDSSDHGPGNHLNATPSYLRRHRGDGGKTSLFLEGGSEGATGPGQVQGEGVFRREDGQEEVHRQPHGAHRWHTKSCPDLIATA